MFNVQHSFPISAAYLTFICVLIANLKKWSNHNVTERTLHTNRRFIFLSLCSMHPTNRLSTCTQWCAVRNSIPTAIQTSRFLFVNKSNAIQHLCEREKTAITATTTTKYWPTMEKWDDNLNTWDDANEVEKLKREKKHKSSHRKNKWSKIKLCWSCWIGHLFKNCNKNYIPFHIHTDIWNVFAAVSWWQWSDLCYNSVNILTHI